MAKELEKLLGKQSGGEGTPKSDLPSPEKDISKRKPAPEPREQITAKLPISLVEELRETSMLLAGPPYKLTMRDIIEQGVQKELKRLKRDADKVRDFMAALDTKQGQQAANG